MGGVAAALALRRVDTAGHLTTIERMLKLCIAQRHRGCQHGLRDSGLVFWSIKRDGEAISLLSIDAPYNEGITLGRMVDLVSHCPEKA